MWRAQPTGRPCPPALSVSPLLVSAWDHGGEISIVKGPLVTIKITLNNAAGLARAASERCQGTAPRVWPRAGTPDWLWSLAGLLLAELLPRFVPQFPHPPSGTNNSSPCVCVVWGPNPGVLDR